MRFKAKLAPEQVSILHWIIGPMTRLPTTTTTSNGVDVSSSSNTRILNRLYNSTTASSSDTRHISSSSNKNVAILYLDTDYIRISKCKGCDGITCFVELNASSSSPSSTSTSVSTSTSTSTPSSASASSIFLDRRIESIAPNNAIVMELDIVQFRAALKSVLSSSSSSSLSTTIGLVGENDDALRYVVIKLAKRQGIPCLCIDACSMSKSNHHGSTSTGSTGNTSIIQVHHAIPVRILRHTEMQYRLPPQLQQVPNVQLEICSNNNHQTSSNLRIVVDRLKNISHTIYIEANNKGELTIQANTDGAVSIQTYFSKLKVQRLQQQELNESNAQQKQVDLSKKTRMKVDTKKLAACLQWQSILNNNSNSNSNSTNHSSNKMVSSAYLCLIENEMIVIHVNVAPTNIGFFTYYVPVHYVSASASASSPSSLVDNYDD